MKFIFPKEKIVRTCSGGDFYEPCGGEDCGVCRAVEYNRSVNSRPYLERWGTEEYFNAVLASDRRAAEKRSENRRSKWIPNKEPSRKRLKEFKVNKSDKPFPQFCAKDGCSRFLTSGEEVWIDPNRPLTICFEHSDNSIPRVLGPEGKYYSKVDMIRTRIG